MYEKGQKRMKGDGLGRTVVNYISYHCRKGGFGYESLRKISTVFDMDVGLHSNIWSMRVSPFLTR